MSTMSTKQRFVKHLIDICYKSNHINSPDPKSVYMIYLGYLEDIVTYLQKYVGTKDNNYVLTSIFLDEFLECNIYMEWIHINGDSYWELFTNSSLFE